MLPYQTLLALERASPVSLPQQLAAALIQLIQRGLLPARTRLPGSRTLATQLGVSRQTVVTAYADLDAQGWIEQRAARGAFVRVGIPEIQPRPLAPPTPAGPPSRAGFAFARVLAGPQRTAVPAHELVWDAGNPDRRLAPLAALARKYRAVCARPPSRGLFGYTAPNGSPALREQLARYLHETRGLPTRADTVFATRGSSMALYLAARLVLRPGDTVVVGERSYLEADRLFAHLGARLLRVPVDDQGLVVADVEALCQHQRVRLLYVTPHHHYPTTVTLSAERRMRLLRLAELHDFVILEDDYDFDYHYARGPILPLASADRAGRVLYVGSLSKVLAPAFRVGYLVAPADFVEEVGHLRSLIDHQGDAILEQSIAELFAEGELLAHLKRVRRVYQQRRDLCCALLREHLGEWFTFTEPAGGLAVWGKFDDAVDLPQLAARCRGAGLHLSDGALFQSPSDARPSHLRLGFASLTAGELTLGVQRLAQALRAQQP